MLTVSIVHIRYFIIPLCPGFNRPSTNDSLRAIEGVTEIWLKQHGDLFLKKISEFCSNNSILMDVVPVVMNSCEEKLVTVSANC